MWSTRNKFSTSESSRIENIGQNEIKFELQIIQMMYTWHASNKKNIAQKFADRLGYYTNCTLISSYKICKYFL